MSQEVYKSTTMGNIPLSFTGRHLLQSLREAVTDAIVAKNQNAYNDALSRARGRIAQYMSELEKKSNIPRCDYTGDEELPASVLGIALASIPTLKLTQELHKRALNSLSPNAVRGNF